MLPFLLTLASILVCTGDDDRLFESPVEVSDHEDLNAVGARLRQVQVLRARFDQEKRIKVLRRPLISDGRFLFAPRHGVYWHTLTPFETRFVITPKGIRQQSAQKEPLVIDATEQPVIHGFTKVFLALFSGDTRELEDRFEVFFSGSASQWRIGLKPKGRIMARLIDRIVLEGTEHIETLRVTERSGDVTLISFSELTTEPAELSEEERACFDF